ncbi:hypothetical protein HMPREF0648_1095 [Prevotella bivia JCVIHMP010]|nr:hypothetical protein HMPREF0648_1095 [Prevotella bivia JCVIHMP010]
MEFLYRKYLKIVFYCIFSNMFGSIFRILFTFALENKEVFKK